MVIVSPPTPSLSPPFLARSLSSLSFLSLSQTRRFFFNLARRSGPGAPQRIRRERGHQIIFAAANWVKIRTFQLHRKFTGISYFNFIFFDNMLSFKFSRIVRITSRGHNYYIIISWRILQLKFRNPTLIPATAAANRVIRMWNVFTSFKNYCRVFFHVILRNKSQREHLKTTARRYIKNDAAIGLYARFQSLFGCVHSAAYCCG